MISSTLEYQELKMTNSEMLAYNKYIAKNSTTAVTHQSQLKQSYGTGLIVKIKGKKFVLTNSHLCLPINESDSIVFGFKTQNESSFNTYSVNELIFNKDHDVCLIPFKDHVISKYAYEFKNITQNFYERYQNTAYQELHRQFAYFFIQTSALVEKQLYTLTFNHKRQHNQVEIYSGSFLNWNFSSPIQMASSNGSETTVSHPRSQSFSLPNKTRGLRQPCV